MAGRIPSARPLLVAAALAAGCSADGPSGTAATTTVTQSGDTSIVVPAMDGPTGRLMSDLIIGGDESDPDALFGRIADAAFGPNGEIYVVDSQASRVSRFRIDGSFDGLLTRDGDGPGEVRSPRRLTVGVDGSVAVASDAEIERFSPTGSVLRTIGTSDVLPPFRLDTSGRLLIHHGPAAPPETATWSITSPGIGPRAVRSIEVLVPNEIRPYWVEVVTPAGTRADSLAGPVELGDLPCALVPDAGGGRICIFVAYAPTTWFDWLPDGRRVDVRTDAYRIDVSPRKDGGPVSIRPPREPEALEGEIAAIIGGSWNRSGEASMDTLFTPRDQKPAISRILPTRDGRIWVRLHAPSESAMNAEGEEIWVETESRFDIFTTEGEHVGYVTGPAEMWIQDIRADTVLVTRVGDYGVPYIERFTVDWSDPN